MNRRKHDIVHVILGVSCIIGLLSVSLLSQNNTITLPMPLIFLIWAYMFYSTLSWISVCGYTGKMTIRLTGSAIMQICVFILFEYSQIASNLIISSKYIFLFLSGLILVESGAHFALSTRGTDDKIDIIDVSNSVERCLKSFFVKDMPRNTISDKEKIVLLSSFSCLIVIISYLLKFVIDIYNFSMLQYTVPFLFAVLCSVLLAVFFTTEIALTKKMNESLAKSVLRIIFCACGGYLFIYTQKDGISLSSLYATVWLLSPYVLNMRKIVHKYYTKRR